MVTKNKNSDRLVILGGHVTGLGIARALQNYSIKIDIWDCSSRCISQKSKLISGFREIQIHSTEAVLDALRTMIREWHGNLHVVPTDDLSTAIISRNKAELQSLEINCWVDEWEKVQVFYDKRKTYALAARIGVPHPMTITAETVGPIEHDIEYPVVLKPSAMEAFSQLHRCKGTICNSRAELEQALKRFAPSDDSYILLAQEYIPGSGSNQYSLGLFRGIDGSLRGLGARRKRQYPAGIGTATYVETTDPADMIDPSRRLLDEIDFVGVCEVEFKRDSHDNKLKLLEVNPRFFKWTSLLAAANVDLVQPFLDPTQLRGETNIPWAGQSIGWQDLFADIAAIISAPGQLSGIGDLLLDIRKKQSDAVFTRNDWRPLTQYLRILPRLARGGRSALTNR
jgi:predicted ATP-grasp superfamily ATP-dependent carboligase